MLAHMLIHTIVFFRIFTAQMEIDWKSVGQLLDTLFFVSQIRYAFSTLYSVIMEMDLIQHFVPFDDRHASAIEWQSQ